VIAALRADPRFPARRRRRWAILALTFVVSVVTMVAVLSGSVEASPGHRTVSAPAMVALLLAMCFLMGSIIFAIATLASAGRIDRRVHRLWTGRIGQALYRLASWRMDHEGPASAPSVTRGAMTLLEALPPEVRRRLAKARPVLERLEQELTRLDQRDRELEAAAADARAGGAPATGTSTDRQQALLSDLDQARRQNGERRIAVLTGLENVRLALVRVKGGIGTADDVDRELAQAARLPG
jgi:hypothetical protein